MNISDNNFIAVADLNVNTDSDGWTSNVAYNINVSNLSGAYYVFIYAYMQAPTKSREMKITVNKAWLD